MTVGLFHRRWDWVGRRCAGALVLLLTLSGFAAPLRKCEQPVPAWVRFPITQATAIREAKGVLKARYGRDRRVNFDELVATRSKRAWIVTTLPPEGMVGGGYEAHIDAQSGCLLFTFISH